MSDGAIYMYQAAAIYGPAGGSSGVTRRMSFPDLTTSATVTGGILHGTWVSDTTISVSDRRLKERIQPLHRKLLAQMAQAKGLVPKQMELGHGLKEQRSAAVDWMLRELRPVSFAFKQVQDVKAMQPGTRYGFVAQEVERVVPDVVHSSGDNKYMIYQDMVAIITLAAQDQQEKIEAQHGDLATLRDLVKRLATKLGRLQQRVVGFMSSMPEPEASMPGPVVQQV